mmetsp:Transcript_49416/g.127530  ORF Transcript_49416/g.127530 Transcript_49416/m.127530 type:complete len:84 (-) Transcript_49416:115-366(-)|eukprot:CAMPEP_0195066278 /NCGR_PEP_ID=MMETSP0448-20130528/11671_1 /TAXON_ID=66468 /ORGANISM="Heterocapsa triquestra, Strain CCMP 448" /LENGTH=83 /DNA_ID=CAMNT_0040097499 /DNA_START=87 /DNA_END=338 /DNA_ORIENTATION=+
MGAVQACLNESNVEEEVVFMKRKLDSDDVLYTAMEHGHSSSQAGHTYVMTTDATGSGISDLEMTPNEELLVDHDLKHGDQVAM